MIGLLSLNVLAQVIAPEGAGVILQSKTVTCEIKCTTKGDEETREEKVTIDLDHTHNSEVCPAVAVSVYEGDFGEGKGVVTDISIEHGDNEIASAGTRVVAVNYRSESAETSFNVYCSEN